MSKTLILSMAICLCVACGTNSNIDNSTVKDLDQSRYLGSWYEIARFDHRFERGLEECKALYTLREDGKIDVTNTGVKNGQPKVSQGKAKTTDNPALLRVSFFGPFYSDYRVMMLDPDYQYALVGSKSEKYLWILSRTPLLEESVKEAILAEATRRGYDVSKLIWVKQ
ncbi:MAG: lipocalin family protein [Bacteroidales bacterium]|nr:lipocalin family protein [Bacteroidales bacterium]